MSSAPHHRGAGRLNFASDNAGPVHPLVMSALLDANEGHANAYGDIGWVDFRRPAAQ